MSKRGAADRPSDIELMMYFDGELEPERREAVEAFLAASPGASRKVRALGVGADMVRRRAHHDASPADGIADLVMAAIERDEAKAVPAPAPKVVAAPAENDNARRIYLFAGLAVAAAAAMLVWGRTSTNEDPFASTPQPTAAEVRESAPSAPVTAAAAPPAPTAAASAEEDSAPGEADPVHGVEIAAVEFGTKMGSIFYVPAGEEVANATTTVVWLAEDVGED